MTLTRIILLLAGMLALLLTVVVFRAETTRVQYETTELERREDALREELRHERLALQRASNPAELLERVRQLRFAKPAPDPARPAADGAKPARKPAKAERKDADRSRKSGKKSKP